MTGLGNNHGYESEPRFQNEQLSGNTHHYDSSLPNKMAEVATGSCSQCGWSEYWFRDMSYLIRLFVGLHRLERRRLKGRARR